MIAYTGAMSKANPDQYDYYGMLLCGGMLYCVKLFGLLEASALLWLPAVVSSHFKGEQNILDLNYLLNWPAEGLQLSGDRILNHVLLGS